MGVRVGVYVPRPIGSDCMHQVRSVCVCYQPSHPDFRGKGKNTRPRAWEFTYGVMASDRCRNVDFLYNTFDVGPNSFESYEEGSVENLDQGISALFSSHPASPIASLHPWVETAFGSLPSFLRIKKIHSSFR